MRLVHWGLLVAGLVASACGGDSESGARNAPLNPGQCRTVTDCAGNQSCVPVADVIVTQTLQQSVAIIAPCPLTACTTDDQCAGMVCQANQGTATPLYGNCFGGSFCSAACTATSCSPGWACADDGHCKVIPCTDPGFAGCPASWFCDEAAAAMGIDPNLPFASLSTEGSDAVFADATAITAGCRQLRCDEMNGPQCIAGWVCDPAGATPTSVGCRALPCGEFGACSDDTNYICVPTSQNGRYDGMDPHGCVMKNCEEGRMCSLYQVCDFTRTDADMSGCSFVKCDEPNGSCPTVGNICDPTSHFPDVYGCRYPNCMEGQQCAPNFRCNPSDPLADSIGCIAPPPTDPMVTPTPMRSPIGGSCNSDANCQQGYCVSGVCRTSPGQCSAQL